MVKTTTTTLAIKIVSMEQIGAVQTALTFVVLAAALGLGLLTSRPSEPELWWQARVEQRLARILVTGLVLLGGTLVLVG
jgi:hypothetical protein